MSRAFCQCSRMMESDAPTPSLRSTSWVQIHRNSTSHSRRLRFFFLQSSISISKSESSCLASVIVKPRRALIRRGVCDDCSENFSRTSIDLSRSSRIISVPRLMTVSKRSPIDMMDVRKSLSSGKNLANEAMADSNEITTSSIHVSNNSTYENDKESTFEACNARLYLLQYDTPLPYLEFILSAIQWPWLERFLKKTE